MISIPLKPFPVNQMFLGRHVQSSKYRKWTEEALWLLKQNKPTTPKIARRVTLIFHLKRDTTTDIDGPIKAQLDILVKAGWIKDDRFIYELVVRKVKSKYDYIEFELE